MMHLCTPGGLAKKQGLRWSPNQTLLARLPMNLISRTCGPYHLFSAIFCSLKGCPRFNGKSGSVPMLYKQHRYKTTA